MLDHFKFKERQKIHPAAPAMLLMFAVIYATISIWSHVTAAAHVGQGIVVAAAVLAAVLIRELSIRVSCERVVFGFGPMRRSVRLSCITGVRIVDADADAGMRVGPGIHRMSDGNQAWIAKTGTAVLISVEDPDMTRPHGYILSTCRPHDLASALRSGSSNRAIEAD